MITSTTCSAARLGAAQWRLLALSAAFLAVGCGSDAGSTGATDAVATDAVITDTVIIDTVIIDTATTDTVATDAESLDAQGTDGAAAQPDTATQPDTNTAPDTTMPPDTTTGPDSYDDPFACQGAPGCNKNADKSACKSAKGCNWTDCIPSKKRDETCDGVDNDCDGIVDNPSAITGPLCFDGDVCSGFELCQGGKCMAGKKLVCAGKACTDAACDSKKGCVYTPNTAACDDGNACTGTKATPDACAAGACKSGLKVVCDDKNPCTVDSCDTKKGCLTKAKTGACDDGQPCTGNDTCSKGVCVGGKSPCDDGKPCTTDLCDAKTGTCSAAQTAGCKLCTAANQCSDKDACTTDTCTGGKCVNAKIAGCFGPTDYAPLKLVVANPISTAPGLVGLNFTARNSGAATKNGPNRKLALWWSVDAKIDGGDTIAYPPTTWAYAMVSKLKPGSPVATGKLILKMQSVGVVPLGVKYLCIRIISPGEKNTTNNDLCAPVPKLKWPQYAMKTFKLRSATPTKLTVGGRMVADVSYQHQQGDAKAKVSINIFMSTDKKLDAGDIPVHTRIYPGAQGVGKTMTRNTGYFYLPTTVTAKHVWMCAAINHHPALLSSDTTPADNVLCNLVTVATRPMVILSNGAAIVLANKAGATTLTPTWGASYRCGASLLVNSGYQPSPGFRARCWITQKKTTPKPALSLWEMSWVNSISVPASNYAHVMTGQKSIAPVKGGLKNMLAPTVLKLDKVPIPIDEKGAEKSWICMELDYKKEIKPIYTVYGTACRELNVKGYSLSVQYDNTAVGSAYYGAPQPATLTRNKALRFVFHVCNYGNIPFTQGHKLAVRVLLSTDKVASADDYVVWKGTASQRKVIPHYQPDTDPKGGCYGIVNFNTTVTLASSVKPGKYYLINQINYDNKFVEPPGGNTVVRGLITVK